MTAEREAGAIGNGRRVSEVMREAPCVLPGDEPAAEALRRVRNLGCGRADVLAPVAGGEVLGVLTRAQLEDAVAGSPGAAEELVGNLAHSDFRVCRPDDRLGSVRQRFLASRASTMLVIDEDGALRGLIRPRDVSPGGD